MKKIHVVMPVFLSLLTLLIFSSYVFAQEAPKKDEKVKAEVMQSIFDLSEEMKIKVAICLLPEILKKNLAELINQNKTRET